MIWSTHIILLFLLSVRTLSKAKISIPDYFKKEYDARKTIYSTKRKQNCMTQETAGQSISSIILSLPLNMRRQKN